MHNDIHELLSKEEKLHQQHILKLIQKNFINSGVFFAHDLSREKCRKIFNVVVDTIGDILHVYAEKDIEHTLRFGKMGMFKIGKIKERLANFGKEKDDVKILPSIKKINFRYGKAMKRKLNRA